MTNLIFFKLQRHSDHHANSYKPYQALESYAEKSPELPYGYSICIMLSTIPFVWSKVIDPIAEAANDDIKLSNEKRNEHHMWVTGTLFAFSMVITYVTFFVFGPENI